MHHLRRCYWAALLAVWLFPVPGLCLARADTQPQNTQFLTLHGTLLSTDGRPVAGASVRLGYDTMTVRVAFSDDSGQFTLTSVRPGSANVTFEAAGYTTISERGILLAGDSDLSRIMQRESATGWWVLLVLIPGVLGLVVVAVQKFTERRGPAPREPENRFFVAAVAGLLWAVTLGLIGWLGRLGTGGTSMIHMFHPSFAFFFYVPILGYIGALLYVLDTFRRGEEKFPKGSEFGLRLIMGPYIAIVMVTLFGNNLGFVELTSPIAQGALAFFSGLLAVVALQALTERGNEWLGRWREQSRYNPSEVAEEFNLTVEEDQQLGKAGVRFLSQLRDRPEDELCKDVSRVGFDPALAADFRRQLRRKQVQDAIGEMAWERLKELHVGTLEEFSHLDEKKLTEIAGQDLKAGDLIDLRDKARLLFAA